MFSRRVAIPSAAVELCTRQNRKDLLRQLQSSRPACTPSPPLSLSPSLLSPPYLIPYLSGWVVSLRQVFSRGLSDLKTSPPSPLVCRLSVRPVPSSCQLPIVARHSHLVAEGLYSQSKVLQP